MGVKQGADKRLPPEELILQILPGTVLEDITPDLHPLIRFYCKQGKIFSSRLLTDFDLVGSLKKSYQFKFKFGSFGGNPGQFRSPWGVAVTPEGNILVADHSNRRVQIFDASGVFIQQISSTGSRNNLLSSMQNLIGLAVDKHNGNIVVTEYNGNKIRIFDSKGKPLCSFGSPGNEPGQLAYPYDVAIDGDGNILVADAGNQRVQIFSQEGKFLRLIAAKGPDTGPRGTLHSCVRVTEDGKIVVIENSQPKVQLYNACGEFLNEYGVAGNAPGELSHPYSGTLDGDGNLIIADYSMLPILPPSDYKIVAFFLTSTSPFCRILWPDWFLQFIF